MGDNVMGCRTGTGEDVIERVTGIILFFVAPGDPFSRFRVMREGAGRHPFSVGVT